MKKLLIVGLLAGASGMALAKLPALSDEAKAKAAEAAAKAAWAGKVDAYKLCKSQDKVAASYHLSAKAAGKETKPAMVLPACADPGAFSPVGAKPIEAAGAHSPTATAVSPPSSKRPDAVVNPVK
ncbi:MAG: hypothetical protein MUP33_09225 [Polaromonas sp.]|nr:hypothetical protein [Polaromonas sp.]